MGRYGWLSWSLFVFGGCGVDEEAGSGGGSGRVDSGDEGATAVTTTSAGSGDATSTGGKTSREATSDMEATDTSGAGTDATMSTAAGTQESTAASTHAATAGDGTGSSDSGDAMGCGSLVDCVSCAAARGCTWIHTGDCVVECDGLARETPCNGRPHCYWDGRSCRLGDVGEPPC